MENDLEIKLKPATFKTFLKSKKFWKPFLGIAIGGLAGFLYYYFVGCSSGTCPITSNPYISIGYGSLMGLLFVKSPCSNGKC